MTVLLRSGIYFQLSNYSLIGNARNANRVPVPRTWSAVMSASVGTIGEFCAALTLCIVIYLHICKGNVLESQKILRKYCGVVKFAHLHRKS